MAYRKPGLPFRVLKNPKFSQSTADLGVIWSECETANGVLRGFLVPFAACWISNEMR